MTEPKNHPEWSGHTGLLELGSFGTVTFFENTSTEGNPISTKHDSIQAFESAYGYKNFDYYGVK